MIVSTARAVGIEVKAGNYESSPTASNFGTTGVGSTRMAAITIQSTVLNDPTLTGGAGIIFYRADTSVNAQLDVGIGCTSTNTPIKTALIYDAGASARSIYVAGTHATAAIETATGAGGVIFGDTLVTGGNTTVGGALLVSGAAGVGYIAVDEQSAAPGTPASNRIRYYAAPDSQSGLSTVRPGDTVLRSKDDAGAIRTILASLGAGCPIVPPTQLYNQIGGVNGPPSKTPVANTWYLSAITIDQPRTLTGMLFTLSTVGTANIRICLFDANGVPVAWSTLAGTAATAVLTRSGGAAAVDTWLRLPFTATQKVNQPGTYYCGIQFDGTSSIFRSYGNTDIDARQVGAAADTADTFASNPIPNLTTLPTTAATAGGVYASLY
jgi:hypothetical protein